MPSLLDHIDRFAYTAQQLQSAAQRTASAPRGPFARAVLTTPLGDLAREIDASELGLFTLITPPGAHAHEPDAANAPGGEVARVEFPGATPLRRPAGGPARRGVQPETEPEVYAEAALKYLDRFQSIRPMPRARQEIISIMDRLAALRESMENMKLAIEQNAQAGSSSLKSSASDEERRIRELQTRVKQLKARKEVLQRSGRATNDSMSSTASTQSRSRVASKPPSFQSKMKAPARAVAPKPDRKEESFWGSGAPPKSAMMGRSSFGLPSGDDSLLMDGSIDLGDTSMNSAMDMPSPLPASRSAPQKRLPKGEDNFRNRRGDPVPKIREAPAQAEVARNPANKNAETVVEEEVPEPGDPSDEEGEKTVVLKRLPEFTSSPPIPPQAIERSALPNSSPSPPSEKSEIEPATPAQPSSRVEGTPPGTGKKLKIRITSETERIVAKIWTSVGDIIMPGHPFHTVGNKPPRAKETIAHLQQISTEVPSPSSPSTQSTSSLGIDATGGSAGICGPTAHQILTGHLLLTLLTEPSHSLPLARVKEALASKGLGGGSAAGVGIAAQGPETRALYGCVAKRLIKIDRGGREQVVRFDV